MTRIEWSGARLGVDPTRRGRVELGRDGRGRCQRAQAGRRGVGWRQERRQVRVGGQGRRRGDGAARRAGARLAARVQAVGQRLLEGGRRRRLTVVQVHRGGGRRGRRGRVGRARRGSGTDGTVRPRVPVARGAVHPLQARVVARLGQQLESDGRLTLPLGSADQTMDTLRHRRYTGLINYSVSNGAGNNEEDAYKRQVRSYIRPAEHHTWPIKLLYCYYFIQI